ncbi:hypothetical protein ZWY2020_017536 [Hordeum vulgare]|nr:hypothetical protein ZWY2020_017536 [Hordeum vulgare]
MASPGSLGLGARWWKRRPWRWAGRRQPEDEEKKMEKAEAGAVIEGTTASFKEESNLVADPEQKALAQIKELVAAALAGGEFDLPPPRRSEFPATRHLLQKILP